MKLTLTQVNRFAKTSKAGKPYTSLSIKANEYGDRYISGFGNKDNAGWKEGDSIEVDVIEKGEYLNFEMPKSAPRNDRSNGSNDEVLAALRTTYAEARAANVNAGKCYAVITDLTRMLLKKGVIELDEPFPTEEDFKNYGT